MYDDERSRVLSAVRRSDFAFESASPSLRGDLLIVRTAVAVDGTRLKFASEALRDHMQTVVIAVISDHRAYWFASARLRAHPIVRGITMALDGKLRALWSAMKSPIFCAGLACDVSYELALCSECDDVHEPSEQSIDTIEDALALVASNGRNIGRVPLSLRNNKVVLIATVLWIGAWHYATESLRNNVSTACAAVLLDGVLLESMTRRVRDRKVVAHAAVCSDACAYEHVTSRLRRNKPLAMLAFQTNGIMLAFAPVEVSLNRALVAVALSTSPEALEYAHQDLLDDDTLIAPLLFCENPGPEVALDFCSRRLYLKYTQDAAVMIRILSKAPVTALKHSPFTIVDDDVLVKKAVSITVNAFQYASDRLRDDDHGLAPFALQKSLLAIDWLSPRLREDEMFAFRALSFWNWECLRLLHIGLRDKPCKLSWLNLDILRTITRAYVGPCCLAHHALKGPARLKALGVLHEHTAF